MNNKKEMLLSYIKANVAPILTDITSLSDINNAIILPANVDKIELGIIVVQNFYHLYG